MVKRHKQIGIGSLSLALVLAGILFSFSFGNRAAIGDTILNFIGLDPWSSGSTGIHYTIIYSIVFYIPAIILGYKFKNDLGATSGKYLSLFLFLFVVILLLAL